MISAMSLRGLRKNFGQKRAVDDLQLEVRQGCMFGLVGPNGAGKTTTLSMATGLLRPDAGTASVLDHDVWSDPVRAKELMGVADVDRAHGRRRCDGAPGDPRTRHRWGPVRRAIEISPDIYSGSPYLCTGRLAVEGSADASPQHSHL